MPEIQDLEKTLWATADKLRSNMDAAEYKHVVLGLIFLKYISDAFDELYQKLRKDKHADPEDRDEYSAENVFYVPPSARWEYLQHQRAKLPSIGKDLDDAMDAIERDNASLKGVLPKDYARSALDKKRLGDSDRKGADLGLDFREYAFYTALEVNDSAVAVLGDDVLRHIARDLVDTVRRNTSIDWTLRENVQAKMRVAVKRILRKHGYPPDMQAKATETVLEQAKLLADQFVEGKEVRYPELGNGEYFRAAEQ